ncbi:MAG: hypothetical protein HQK56_15105 [Deltaproteobacteria bacterium]|nr:hypothetical protein [Deltaproteobacteria bacterium]
MPIKLGTFWKRLFYLIGFGLIVWLAVYYLYPKVIFEIYGKDIPPRWTSDLGGMNLGQIRKKLGSPHEDLSAKGYQNWLEYHSWGRKKLMVGCADVCKSNEKPLAVIYIVYVNGWYNPAYQKVIAGAGKNRLSYNFFREYDPTVGISGQTSGSLFLSFANYVALPPAM